MPKVSSRACRQLVNSHRLVRARTRIRGGSTLLDVALGSSLLALLLVPSLHLVSQSRRVVERCQVREQLLLEADRLLQTVRVELRDPARLRDAFTSPRDEILHLQTSTLPHGTARLIIAPEASSGTAVHPLVQIQVQCWQDHNDDQRPDADEPIQTLSTLQGAW